MKKSCSLSSSSQYGLFLLLATVMVFLLTTQAYALTADQYSDESVPAAIEVGAAPVVSTESTLNPLLYVNAPEQYIHSAWHLPGDLEITWQIPESVEAVAVALTDDSAHEPRYLSASVFSPAINNFVVKKEAQHPGGQFVNLQMKDENGWSAVTSLQINIDEEPPLPFSITATGGQEPGSQPAVTFTAFDKGSGVDRYEVTLKTLTGQTVGQYELPAQLNSNTLSFGDLAAGEYQVIAKAVDKVGNTTVSEKNIKFDPQQKMNQLTDTVFAPINIIVYGLSFLVLLQFLLYCREKASHQKRENRLATETKDVNQQIKRVFLALHEDVAEQVGQIRKNSRVTKKEIADNLAQSLEVSEILLNKEVEDVEKILTESRR